MPDPYLQWRVRLGLKTTRPCRRDVHLLVIRYDSWFIGRESSHWPNEAISSVKENETAAVMHRSRIFWDGGVLMECAVKVKWFTSDKRRAWGNARLYLENEIDRVCFKVTGASFLPMGPIWNCATLFYHKKGSSKLWDQQHLNLARFWVMALEKSALQS